MNIRGGLFLVILLVVTVATVPAGKLKENREYEAYGVVFLEPRIGPWLKSYTCNPEECPSFAVNYITKSGIHKEFGILVKPITFKEVQDPEVQELLHNMLESAGKLENPRILDLNGTEVFSVDYSLQTTPTTYGTAFIGLTGEYAISVATYRRGKKVSADKELRRLMQGVRIFKTGDPAHDPE